MRVCVIGAGVAGLVCAKVLKADGFDVTVFEKDPTVGGVWAPSRAYAGLRANNPREAYVFSDFPYPEIAEEFPTAGQIRSYLEAYAEHFGIDEDLRLSAEVLSVSRLASPPGFRVEVRPTSGVADPEAHDFDFVVVCNGVFSVPYVPEIEGQERFGGSRVHSSELVDPGVLEGKRVVVVGAGKSALDCASLAGPHADSSTLVFRTPHWMFPRYFFRGVRVDHVIGSRFAEMALPTHHGASRLETVLRTAATPLLWLWRRAISRLVSRRVGMPPAMIPPKPVTSGGENIGAGEEFFEALRRGEVEAKRAGIAGFSGEGLRLDTGEEIPADLVVFATGWRQEVPFLDAELLREVRRDGRFHLYRHILPPGEPRLGFVGYASSGNSMLTSEIAAHWLSEWFLGGLDLPDRPTMEREIARVHEWAARVFPGRREGYFVGGYITRYVDELMRDMGLPTRRTGNVLTEYLDPFYAERYAGLPEERKRKRRHVGSGTRPLEVAAD